MLNTDVVFRQVLPLTLPNAPLLRRFVKLRKQWQKQVELSTFEAASAPRWKGPATVVPLPKSPHRQGAALDLQVDSETSRDSEDVVGPVPTQAASTASSAFPRPELNPAEALPSMDTISDSTPSRPAAVPSVAPEPGPHYDHQTQVQQPADNIMDEAWPLTRANHHYRQAGFIYETLLYKNQQLESELAACRKELEDLKQNRTSAQTPVNSIAEIPNKKAMRDSTFTPASNDRNYSKSVRTNRTTMHKIATYL
ncbi:hypothetical protein BJ912DRAFT_956713 [Pholiota molesta]|nr:hypothetical protein BJ912DRAFT_956713 [Pholiota molesta]